MAILTDPARELYDVANLVKKGSGEQGFKHLANVFNVRPWSTEFLRIVYYICERADLIANILQNATEIDHEIVQSAQQDLADFKSAFAGGSLFNKWNENNGGMQLVNVHGERIKYLTTIVRNYVSYPRLDSDEVSELVGLIHAYMEEVEDDAEIPSFAKHALKTALDGFLFQLTKLQWASAEYTLAAFRQLQNLYDRLRRMAEETPEMDSAAWLNGFKDILDWFSSRVESVKRPGEAGVFLLSSYNLLAPSVGLPPLQLPSPD